MPSYRTPTDEQQAAIDYFASGSDLVLEAGAGTGKTSTLQMLAMAAEDQGLYLAYNKAIQTEAGNRFPPHVPARTAHSLAFREVGRNYADRLNADRMAPWDVAKFLGITQRYTEDSPSGTRHLMPNTVARLALEMVDRFCQSADRVLDVHHRPYVEGIENHDDLADALLPFARKAWADLVKPDGKGGVLRFNHDHYLKLFQLSDPVLRTGFVLFDEAQDANPCIAHIVAAQKCQKVYVGDRAQSIYGWRGAVDAMDIPGVPVLYLSKSFRFGPEVAAEANRWLEMLETPLRLTGNESIDSYVDPDPFGDPRAILCRTNGAAVSALMAAQDKGVKAHLQGGGNEIINFCRGVDDLRGKGASSHRDLAAFKSWGEVQDYVEEDKSAGDLKVLVNLVETYGTDRLVDALRKMYPDEETAQMTISTAHKAKGREWDAVQIHNDFAQRLNEVGDPVDYTREDIMLRYVAVTRAQFALDRGPLAPDWKRPERSSSYEDAR